MPTIGADETVRPFLFRSTPKSGTSIDPPLPQGLQVQVSQQFVRPRIKSVWQALSLSKDTPNPCHSRPVLRGKG